ncbi:odorant receptor 131-2-like [Genypterus blacodes]|uniref:odorant receptor 131-2-like n=1 Tax=Genypterus blacodes TaxID=154954 RepID=UPI003F76AE27
MGDNNSWVGVVPTRRKINVIIVQVVIAVFLCINLLQLLIFFRNEFFYTKMRYILFANTLLCDSLFLIISNILLNLDYFQFTLHCSLCLIICIVVFPLFITTPITLTAMTLERFVAICMPLRHGELCTTRNSLHCILIIYSISSIPLSVFFSTFFATAPRTVYTQHFLCSLEVFILHSWQGHLISAINQLYFLIITVTVILSYVKIVQVAKGASGEKMKSSWKGLRTVSLHAVQLVLSFTQMWCPFIEAAVLQIDFVLYINVRYADYVVFILGPRCLSPLIYGLRDEKFFMELKYTVGCGSRKKKCSHSPV